MEGCLLPAHKIIQKRFGNYKINHYINVRNSRKNLFNCTMKEETVYFYYGKPGAQGTQYCTPNETLAYKRAAFYGSEVFILRKTQAL